MNCLRQILRFLAIAGLCLSGIGFCLALMNITHIGPVNLHRTHDLFIAFCVFAMLYMLASPSPRVKVVGIMKMVQARLAHPRAFLWITACMLILYLVDAIIHHLAFKTMSHDFSMIDEALHATRKGALFSPILGRSFLSEHFSPILFVLVPLHRMFNSPWFLVVLQPLMLWGAVFPFRALLTHCSHLPRWQINFLALVFLNHALMISTLEYLFHMECMIPILVLATVCFAEKQKYFLYAGALVATLCIKEDMGIYLCGLGLFYAMLRNRKLLGSLTMTAGILWTFVAIRMVMPYYAGSGAAYPFASRWRSWGDSPLDILAGFAGHPLRFTAAMFNANVLLLLFSLAFIPLLKLKKGYWMLFVIPWIINATSDFDMQSELKLYYGIPLFTFMLVAIVLALKDQAVAWPVREGYGAALVAFLLVVNCCHFKLPHVPRARAAIIRDIANLPPTQTIMASSCLFPVLGYDRDKVLIQSLVAPSTQLVLLKQGTDSWPLTKEQSYSFADLCLRSGYDILWQHGDFIGFSKRIAPLH